MTSLHLRGVVLPGEETRDLWVVNGRIRFTPVPYAETVVDGGFLVPGLVDAHCHIGISPSGNPSLEEAEQQALVDRDAGTLLVRDCGAPIDTRPLQERLELPRIVRAGPSATSATWASRSRTRLSCRTRSPSRPRTATAG